ncbi:MAG TPA: alpha/beta hydrolase [Pyrinomonadaceae bacterium]|nr:alpha/beta hydrolase [Pyrinomonadaceae bacterium]
MTRNVCALALLVLLLSTFAPSRAQAQEAVGGGDWADTLGSDYEVRSNITYSRANNADLKLDLYLPRDRPAPVPTVMFIHGGGWVEGSKEIDVLNLLPYLSLKFAVVNVGYRLGRASLAPAAVEDCRCALRWIQRNAKQLNLDTSRIVLTGISAGGHLALITGMLPTPNVFDRACPTDDSVRWNSGTEPQPKVAAIVNVFGITDVADLLEGGNAKHYAIEWFGSMGGRTELARQVSPVTHVRAGLPPVITIHGDADDVVPYSHAVRLHDALEREKVPNQLFTIKGGGHGGFNRQQILSSYAEVRKFLRQHNVLKQ